MRDRRNTHMSTLSTSSSASSSSNSATSTPARTSLSEKDVEGQVDEVQIEDRHHPRLRRSKCSDRLIFYRTASTICILLFVCVSMAQHAFTGTRPSPPTFSHARDMGKPYISPRSGAILVHDEAGRKRWTVSIPQNSTFPLASPEYERICTDVKHLRAQDGLTTWHKVWREIHGRLDDPAFMDIAAAQSNSALAPDESLSQRDVCDSSLTFIIDRNEASFGKTLLMLWLSYGFAKREGKAFFLDDSQWLYGKYDAYFPPLPRPACTRPSSHHIVPCPLQAKHVVITASTADIAFEPYERSNMMFDMLRSGYEATFGLIGDDAKYAQQRELELRKLATDNGQPLVGMHIRRGDLRPFELEYSQDYLPLERFTDAAKLMLSDGTPTSLIMASDDPDIIESPDLVFAASPHILHKSQERIQLATKLALDRSSPALPIREAGSAYVKHVDENTGWDGGFYTGLFLSTGGHNTHQVSQRVLSAAPSQETLRLRELIGRGYILDLSVLSKADGVVCAVSSAACRLLAVMMGHDAVRAGRWVNVDDHRPWSWNGLRS